MIPRRIGGVTTKKPRLNKLLIASAIIFTSSLAWQNSTTFAFSEAPFYKQPTNNRRTYAAHTVSEPQSSNLKEAISICLPENWRDSNTWSQEAAHVLTEYGAVALISKHDESGLIKKEICDNANTAAATRLNDMRRRIESRGLDPTGVDEPYRFSEIICRDDGGKRYDVPIAFLGESSSDEEGQEGLQSSSVGSGRIGTPLEPNEEEAIAELHKRIDEITKPVMNSLWSQSDFQSSVAAAGFLMNEPGSKSQNWHRDGPEEGFIDCFVPLIDLNESLGPTAIKPGTHTDKSGKVGETNNNNDVLVPILNKGEVLLFDYRTIHRGQGNKSKSITRTLAYAVYKRKELGSMDTSGDIHNFPAALTLEYD